MKKEFNTYEPDIRMIRKNITIFLLIKLKIWLKWNNFRKIRPVKTLISNNKKSSYEKNISLRWFYKWVLANIQKTNNVF